MMRLRNLRERNSRGVWNHRWLERLKSFWGNCLPEIDEKDLTQRMEKGRDKPGI
jgi:hypothetical protein